MSDFGVRQQREDPDETSRIEKAKEEQEKEAAKEAEKLKEEKQ